jgi:hypothetical protein
LPEDPEDEDDLEEEPFFAIFAQFKRNTPSASAYGVGQI